MCPERVLQAAIAYGGCLPARQDHEIFASLPGQFKLVESEAFPDEALDSIPAGRLATILFGNRHTQPAVLPAIAPVQNTEKCIAGNRRAGKHVAKISFCVEADLA